jgi:hypothetical protein
MPFRSNFVPTTTFYVGSPEGEALLSVRLLRRVRHRLNLFTSEVQPNAVGQMLKFVCVNGHHFGAEAKPPTDVDLN